jgi:hypothetical protein
MAAKHLPGAPVEHFGELARPRKYGLRLTREMYALVNKKPSTRIPEHMLTDELRAYLAPRYEDAEMTIRSDEYCRQQREAALVKSLERLQPRLELLPVGSREEPTPDPGCSSSGTHSIPNSLLSAVVISEIMFRPAA